jgi:Holliday junction resolvase
MDHLRPTGKPDLDNYLKTLDACNNIVWVDDSQVVSATVMKRYGQNPGITVTVSEWMPGI